METASWPWPTGIKTKADSELQLAKNVPLRDVRTPDRSISTICDTVLRQQLVRMRLFGARKAQWTKMSTLRLHQRSKTFR